MPSEHFVQRLCLPLWRLAEGLQGPRSQADPHQELQPGTNVKAERFIKNLLEELAYAMDSQTSEERTRWLPRYLTLYNGIRCHMALGGIISQQRLQVLLPE